MKEKQWTEEKEKILSMQVKKELELKEEFNAKTLELTEEMCVAKKHICDLEEEKAKCESFTTEFESKSSVYEQKVIKLCVKVHSLYSNCFKPGRSMSLKVFCPQKMMK